jgi:hypothetical protein
VFLHGDIGGLIDGKVQVVPVARTITNDTAQWDANVSSGAYRGSYVLIARPGTRGGRSARRH